MSHKEPHKPSQGIQPGKRPHRQKKSGTWTLPTVLGLALSVTGGVGIVELRPQLAVSPGDQLAENQPFSAPFEITNTGYLGVHIEDVTVIFPIIKTSNMTITDSSINSQSWDNFDLERGGSKTIVAYFAKVVPIQANIVIAVDYRFLWHSWRWFFRFDGIHIDSWRWSKQPLGDLRSSVNKAVDASLEKHRRAIQQSP